MGGGGKGKRGGGMRKAGKRAGGAARKTGKKAGSHARTGAKVAGRAGRHTSRAANRHVKSATRGISRHTQAGLRASRKGIKHTYHATSRMAKRSHGIHFCMPGIKIRKFPSIRMKFPNMNFSKLVHHSRYRRSHYGSHNNDTYYQNSSNGYHCYDDVNSYHHRRYARTHRYRPVVSKDPEMVSYDSMRMSLPPDSPNFCFIPLTTMSMCGTTDEDEAIKCDHFNVMTKVLALVSRPYSVDESSMSVLSASIKNLLNGSGTLLRGMQDSEDNGWYIPDFLCYGCIVGKSKQQRMNEFSEQEMEETSDEIVVMWNKDTKIAARGISISFVDIGHSFCGFTLEVLPYISVPTAAVAGGSTMMPNPQFFVAPSAPPVDYTSSEMKAISFMSQASRGDRIDEKEYDEAFDSATQDFNSQSEAAMTEDEIYAPFLVVVPAGVFAGGLLMVQSPDGILYSVEVPADSPPGSSLLVTPGTLAQSDVVVTPYVISSDSAPPSYSQSFFHMNVIGSAEDTTVPPPYDPRLFPPLPMPVASAPLAPPMVSLSEFQEVSSPPSP